MTWNCKSVILKQEIMRTRQPWDKTGTKQIHCLKLTSKHIAWGQSSTNNLKSILVLKLLLKFEVFFTREDYISLYVDTIKMTAVKEDPSRFFVVSRFLKLLFPFDFQFLHFIFQPIKWRGKWRSWLHCRKPTEQPVGGHPPLWLQVIKSRKNYCQKLLYLFCFDYQVK